MTQVSDNIFLLFQYEKAIKRIYFLYFHTIHGDILNDQLDITTIYKRLNFL